eukprot:gene10104-21052_t
MQVSTSQDSYFSVDDKSQDLWKKTSGDGSLFQNWVQRHFTLSIRARSFFYVTKTNGACYLPLETGCIIQELADKYYGRKYCFRILWPTTGHDIILSAESEAILLEWKTALIKFTNPPEEVKEEQKRLLAQISPRGSVLLSRKFLEREVIHRKDLNIKSNSIFFSFESKMDQLLLSVGKSTTQKSPTRKLLHLDLSVSAFDDPEVHHINHDLEHSGIKPRQRRRSSMQAKLDAEEYMYSIGYPVSLDVRNTHLNQQYIPPEFQVIWNQFRKLFSDRNQEELKRFLAARNWNLEKATTFLKEHISWRKLNIPVRPQSCMEELIKAKCFVHGVDRTEHPIIYYFTRKQDPKTRKIDEVIRMLVYRMEQAIVKLPDRDGKITIVFCRDGSTNANLDIEIIKPVADVFQKNYPERLYTCIVWPSGVVFRSLWSIASVFLDPSTKNKVLPLANKEDLLQYISEEHLLPELGGNSAFQFEAEIAKDPILTPRLWTDPRSLDYYPPPVQREVRQPLSKTHSNFARTRTKSGNKLELFNVFESP